MRGALGALLVFALLAISPIALAEAEWENYQDSFREVSYSGNDGSLDWNGPWKEEGESNGPSEGAVRVEGSACSGQCLVIGVGLVSVATGAYRFADTGDFTDAKLSYIVDFDGELFATLTVEATSNGGTSWSTVDSILLGSGGDVEPRQVDVTAFSDERFGIRFRVTGAVGASVLIDDVEVAGTVDEEDETTTTTSSTTTTTVLLDLIPTTLPDLLMTTTTSTTTTTTSTTTTSTPSTATTSSSSGNDDGGTTTTHAATTTTIASGAGGGDADGPGDGRGNGESDIGETGAVPTSRLLQTPIGLASDIPSGMFGSTTPEVLGFEVAAGFSDAVELIKATWIWVLGLALLLAGVVITGIDRRVTPVATHDSAV